MNTKEKIEKIFIFALIFPYMVIRAIFRKSKEKSDERKYEKLSQIAETDRRMQKSGTLTEFYDNYKLLCSITENLIRLGEKFFVNGELPVEMHIRVQESKHDYVFEVIKREYNFIEEKMRNNAYDKTEHYAFFCREIETFRSSLDDSNLKFACECRDKIFSEYIADCSEEPIESNVIKSELPLEDLVNNEMKKIDQMTDFGWEFEDYVSLLLKYNGFLKTEVTRASNDFGIDVIATNEDGVRYGIQCKCYSDKIGIESVQESFAGKTFYNCHVAVVITNNYFTPSAVSLARVNGVFLWDRDKLYRLVCQKVCLLTGKFIV